MLSIATPAAQPLFNCQAIPVIGRSKRTMLAPRACCNPCAAFIKAGAVSTPSVGMSGGAITPSLLSSVAVPARQ